MILRFRPCREIFFVLSGHNFLLFDRSKENEARKQGLDDVNGWIRV